MQDVTAASLPSMATALKRDNDLSFFKKVIFFLISRYTGVEEIHFGKYAKHLRQSMEKTPIELECTPVRDINSRLCDYFFLTSYLSSVTNTYDYEQDFTGYAC
jgi:hypothetical protein